MALYEVPNRDVIRLRVDRLKVRFSDVPEVIYDLLIKHRPDGEIAPEAVAVWFAKVAQDLSDANNSEAGAKLMLRNSPVIDTLFIDSDPEWREAAKSHFKTVLK